MDERVAIIGAGVVGLACATQLQMRGHEVTVIDPRPPGEYCSFGNAGCLSRASCVPLALPGLWRKVPGWLLDPSGPLHIRLRYLRSLAPWLWQFQRASSPAQVTRIADALHSLLTVTIDKWRPLAERAGAPELIVQRGYAFAYESEAAFNTDALGREIRLAHQVRIDVLRGADITAFDSALSPQLTHLVVLPEQGHCPNPLRLSQALANRLRDGGATFVAEPAVAFDRIDGRVVAVQTAGGAIATDAVVIAAGAHSAALASQLGNDVPLTTERGYHVTLESPTVMPRVPIASGEGKYFATPMEVGLRVAGTVELASLGAPPDYRRADALLAKAQRLLPGLRGERFTRWMGHRPSLPDSLPVIGRSRAARNALLAFGHGHVGLTAAAPTAEIVADLVGGREPFIDIAPYAAERFQKGPR
jgi:D-amino-acid dehydrogenase